MKHSCHWLKTRNDLYHLEEIELVDTKWVLHNELKANEQCVYDGDATQVGEVIHDYKIVINFCPYCGEKLNNAWEARQTGFHKWFAPQPKHPILPPDDFYQCSEIATLNIFTAERWFIVRDPDETWLLERYTPATKELVQMEKADYIGELCFLSGFDILFCPFCGELLDAKRLSQLPSL